MSKGNKNKNRVIIYGIGAGGGQSINFICAHLSNRYEVIGYMDSFYQKGFYQYQKVFKMEDLSGIQYDYILINTCRQSSDDEIYDLLLKHGISKKKIVRYAKYAFYNNEYPIKYIENKVEVFQRLAYYPKFKGYIVGMSYAEHGIDVNQLSEYTYNFAHAAFDLYYRKLLIESLFKAEKGIKDIRYIILELPYYIFNFDLSLCDNGIFQSAINYLAYWGDYHHFTEKKDNINFIEGFSVYQDMFIKDHIGNSSMIVNRRMMIDRHYVEKKAECTQISHTIRKCHQTTIEENRHIFHEIVQIIKEKNFSIKLVILICPQPSVIRKLYDDYPLQKQIFLNEMRLAQRKNPNLVILDEHKLFAGHDEYFLDIDGHVNRKGCDILTGYLDGKLKELHLYRR